MATIRYTVPGLEREDAEQVVDLLQNRLHALNDLQLTLKHVHWNVTGPNFIAVHEMLDPQVDAVRSFVDEVAERIATLGGSPDGRPGALVRDRTWGDYSIGRDDALAHLGALDVVYTGLIAEHRAHIEKLKMLDPVTQDMLITQAGKLEQHQWFVRAHLEDADGSLKSHSDEPQEGATDTAR